MQVQAMHIKQLEATVLQTGGCCCVGTSCRACCPLAPTWRGLQAQAAEQLHHLLVQALRSQGRGRNPGH